METDKFKVIDSNIEREGFINIKKLTVQHKQFSGEWSSTFTREFTTGTGASSVLLYDPKIDEVVLIEQFRAGAIGKENGPWLKEIVCGKIDYPDSPEDTAIRESLEEANLKIKKLIPISNYFVSPGNSDSVMHLFLGIVDLENYTPGIHGLKDENEDIKAITLKSSEAFKQLANGSLNNAITMIALQWLQINLTKIPRLLS